MAKSIRFFIFAAILIFILIFIVLSAGSSIFTDWLWFKELNFEKTFMIMFMSNFILRIIIGVIFASVIYLNLHFTKKPIVNFINIKTDNRVETLFGEERSNIFNWLNKKRINIIYLTISIVFGFLFSSISSESWKMVLKFLNRTSFQTVDPIFSKDIGFYVFTLPFLRFVREMGMVLVIISLIFTGFIYLIFTGVHSFNDLSIKLSSRGKKHLSILVFVFLLFKAWDYRIKMYDILFSPRGVVFGAGYTDVNANLLAYRILFFTVLFVAAAVVFSFIKNNYKFVIWGIGAWIAVSIIFSSLYPAFMQQFRVEPNEITLESKYIKNNIDMTLSAYGLDDVEEKDYEIKNDLTYDKLMENPETINNIRLWDDRPLLDTYSQIQELRQYYKFINVDIDRYEINSEYRQVMLAARELDQSLLSPEAQTWVNKTLKYTHGFGVVMSPVNKITPEGLPEFYIKDIPPKIDADIELNNSAVYYGEKTDNYVIVNTESTEFHYPMGSENVYINYDGSGGVKINNFLRKAIYAMRLRNMKLILSTDINNDSRIMYYRNIKERVQKAAPFLKYDSDPYLVIDKGRLFWIYDAYTTTNSYPYSQPYNKGDNYIRNSVKVVIDAYNGDMDFYVIDEKDPIARTYMKIFDDLFTPGEEMSDSLRKHLRYPKDLFKIQTELYGTYHMKDPVVFYNKEDVWNIPKETYSNTAVKVDPYYIINNLPGEEDSEFILMSPFTPANKNNMVSWMAARSDGDRYGDILVYKFPKDNLIYGPTQIESRIDQESGISQLLTLWSQRGSQVIRGNLLVIPIDHNILYVEPIYLQAETSRLPELKRIVAAYKNDIVMRESLGAAFRALFDEDEPKIVGPGEEPAAEDKLQEDESAVINSVESLAAEANRLFNEAQNALREGNFSEYGKLIDQLGQILNQLIETGE
ncbi:MULTISPECIES: UPF0182 family protein [unclassified Halanaerobium]|uniref:UPF0182 family membrane protein n=1 Tax=unclassified Halanaerobium TaxID=2641197 RepID=UPI000DF29E1C|nr:MULTISPECIES: UPF0182 family protein [unclassified Halanaerobium]RCW51467.1 hypothetical protein DFR78_101116 [Halanaerobium sp. MA284_MarDTE_T2]RCW89255.1 hypothetical protein DER71_10166 [Halanaerobium sp. DL-01]